MASAEHEPITGVWGHSPQQGPGAEPLVRGSGGRRSWKHFGHWMSNGVGKFSTSSWKQYALLRSTGVRVGGQSAWCPPTPSLGGLCPLGSTAYALNICCDIPCLTFQLPHITTGSFQSHRWQPTTGSLQSLQRLKERNKPSVRWKSFALHKLVWWHFQVEWASGLLFVFFWDNVNNQKYVWLILLKMTFIDFPR